MKNLLVIFILTISFNNLYSQAISYRYMTPKKGHAQDFRNGLASKTKKSQH
jgi:hypothetical protein